MKIQMFEYYQDASINLHPDQIAEVNDELAAWLIEHRKAKAVQEAKPARHLDVEPQFEQAEEPPKSQRLERPKSRRGAK